MHPDRSLASRIIDSRRRRFHAAVLRAVTSPAPGQRTKRAASTRSRSARNGVAGQLADQEVSRRRRRGGRAIPHVPRRRCRTLSLQRHGWAPISQPGGLPTILNICPTNPSGVQFASPMRPSGLHTRISSAATPCWIGAEHRHRTSRARRRSRQSSKGIASASTSRTSQVEPISGGPCLRSSRGAPARSRRR